MKRRLVSQLSKSLTPVFDHDPTTQMFFKRLIIPDQIHQWKVDWVDDWGVQQTNTAWRVQHSNLLGPYKGGLRFHQDSTIDVFEALALEQTFKNSLTGRPMGGAKGGSDFDSSLHSEREIHQFVNGFVRGLKDHIGTGIDVPAGDMGVDEKMIGLLYGQLVRQNKCHDQGAFTGKHPTYLEGSTYRAQATGEGVAYLADYHCRRSRNHSIQGQRVLISGNGNVGFYAAKTCIEYGAIVHTISNRNGTYFAKNGFTMQELNDTYAFTRQGQSGPGIPATVNILDGSKPWDIDCPVDIALPCSIQYDINHQHMASLVARGCHTVAEGANLACTEKAVHVMHENDITYMGGKLANIGGVIGSHEEMIHSGDRAQANVLKSLCDAYDASVHSMHQYDSDHIMTGATIASFQRMVDVAKYLGVY